MNMNSVLISPNIHRCVNFREDKICFFMLLLSFTDLPKYLDHVSVGSVVFGNHLDEFFTSYISLLLRRCPLIIAVLNPAPSTWLKN